MATNLKPLPPWLAIDERKAERWPMDMAAFLQTQLDPALAGVRVVDISSHGCLLAVSGEMPVGRYVTLTLPQAIAAEGWIVWSKGGHAGLDFAHPLPPAVLERILDRHGREGIVG